MILSTKSLNLLANIISILSNPLLVIYLTVVVGFYSSIQIDASIFYMMLFSVFIPVIIFYLLKIVNISGANLEKLSLDRESRNGLFLFTLFALGINLYFFLNLKLNSIYSIVMVLMIYVGLLYILNKFVDKLSMHSSAFTFLVMVLADRLSPLFFFLIFLLPLIYWSRIWLHKHTIFQLYVGSGVGLICGFLIWLL